MVSRVMPHCPHGAVRRARWPVGCECPAGAKLPEVTLELGWGGLCLEWGFVLRPLTGWKEFIDLWTRRHRLPDAGGAQGEGGAPGQGKRTWPPARAPLFNRPSC